MNGGSTKGIWRPILTNSNLNFYLMECENYRKQNEAYILVDCVYTEDWDAGKRHSVAKAISGDDYITYLALDKDRVVGFIGLLKQLEGPYMILDMMHVSAECRGHGIGRRLFCKGKEEAR